MIGRITVAASAVAAAQAITCKAPAAAIADLYEIAGAEVGDQPKETADLAITCATGATKSVEGEEPTITYGTCNSDGDSYTLTGCKADIQCIVPNGSKYLLAAGTALTSLKHSQLAASAFKCPEGHESNGDAIIVTPCASADGEYKLTGGCQKKPENCLLPGNAEHFLMKNGDAVVAKKVADITAFGTADFKCAGERTGPVTKVEACTTEGGEWTLTGCDTDVLECKAPTDVAGYKGLDSLKKNADTTGVSCNTDTHKGTAKVHFDGCKEDNLKYTVSGCELKGFNCMVPDNSKMYTFNKIVVATNRTNTDGFFKANSTANPAVFECADKYVRTNTTAAPKVTVCGEKDTEFKLSGCEAKKVTAFKPQPSSAFTAAATGAVLRTAVVVMSAVMYLKM